MNTQYQPLTPADMKIKTPPFSLTRPIIIEGVPDVSLLSELGKDTSWLKNKIQPIYTDIYHCVLTTIDDNENVRVYTDPNK